MRLGVRLRTDGVPGLGANTKNAGRAGELLTGVRETAPFLLCVGSFWGRMGERGVCEVSGRCGRRGAGKKEGLNIREGGM